MYHRFELYIDGEYQGCGIFQGLTELDMEDEEFEALTLKFDTILNIPLSVYTKAKNTTAWFTESGYHYFEKEIEKIQEAYENQGLFDVIHLMSEIDPQKIIYQDEFQIIVSPTE